MRILELLRNLKKKVLKALTEKQTLELIRRLEDQVENYRFANSLLQEDIDLSHQARDLYQIRWERSSHELELLRNDVLYWSRRAHVAQTLLGDNLTLFQNDTLFRCRVMQATRRWREERFTSTELILNLCRLERERSQRQASMGPRRSQNSLEEEYFQRNPET